MRLSLFAWLGSIALMAGALYFQYFQGLDPCVLCTYQRIPHIAAILLGALAIWKFPRLYPLLGLIVLAGAGVAGFHVGVEFGWWEGLSTCSGDMNASFEDVLKKAPARCDQVPWSFLGLSMAAWNGLVSLVLAGMWFRGRHRLIGIMSPSL